MNVNKYRDGAKLPLNDDGNALRVTHYLGDRLRYVKNRDQWFNWDSCRWNRATDADMLRVGRAVANYIDDETATLVDTQERDLHRKHAARSHGVAAIKAMIELARGDASLWRGEDEFDPDPYLVNFTNGTVDVRTRELRPHDPTNWITGLVPHRYRPEADAPTFRKLVERTFQDAGRDGETVHFVHKLLGYATLVGRNVEQVIVFVIGPENCGKSKVLEIPSELLGPDYAHKSKTDLISRKSRGHHDSERFSIVGKRFVTISETSSLFNLDESTVKELTGDLRMTARQMYKGYELNPLVTWTVALASNDFPNVLEWDGAIKRRVIAVPAGPSLAGHEVIKDLDSRIIDGEAEGVLAWLVAGAHAWHQEWQAAQNRGGVDRTGLAKPTSVELFTERYAQSQDHVGVFVSERLVLDAHCERARASGKPCKTPKTDVHAAFKKWRGVGEASNRNKLYAQIYALPGVTYDARTFTGLCLRLPSWSELYSQASGD